ncbi:MAG: antirestriction protein ArdA, partial [Bacteroidales bacterium]|nr:antirestriction protein ArdA [Bacteroidales bacterium]
SVARYFDYESYGRDIRMESNCCVTSFGLVIDNR